MNASDFANIMDGHVMDKAPVRFQKFNKFILQTYIYQLNDKLVRGSLGYIDNPTESDRIHCVVFVISCEQRVL